MKKIFYLASCCCLPFMAAAQQHTATDGDWSSQFVVLKNTAEADCMIRVGDIDNLGFGWSESFIPFSGRSTDPHAFPWEIDPKDAGGTDRIFVPTGYKEGSGLGIEGYTSSTTRPGNTPKPIIIPLSALKDIQVNTASLQLFVDDFQAPEMNSSFRFFINGHRFIEAEKIINKINQGGPVGKLINIRLTNELLQFIAPDSTLRIFIDDQTSGVGDGFAIDFAKLLINPKGLLYKGNITGRIIDAATRMPVGKAVAEVRDYGTAITNNNGEFTITDVPAGLDIVSGSATGYSAAQKQVDVISGQTSDPVEIALTRSGKVQYNNKTLQEGDNLVMNNVQFEVNSAILLATGRQELDKLVSFMKINPAVEILLSGFTSAEGSVAANTELSLKRVRSCKNYLVEKGIDEGRITIKGMGPENPVAPNDTESNRARNRRVEMKITKL